MRSTEPLLKLLERYRLLEHRLCELTTAMDLPASDFVMIAFPRNIYIPIDHEVARKVLEGVVTTTRQQFQEVDEQVAALLQALKP